MQRLSQTQHILMKAVHKLICLPYLCMRVETHLFLVIFNSHHLTKPHSSSVLKQNVISIWLGSYGASAPSSLPRGRASRPRSQASHVLDQKSPGATRRHTKNRHHEAVSLDPSASLPPPMLLHIKRLPATRKCPPPLTCITLGAAREAI